MYYSQKEFRGAKRTSKAILSRSPIRHRPAVFCGDACKRMYLERITGPNKQTKPTATLSEAKH